jgi:hypothetical protein
VASASGSSDRRPLIGFHVKKWQAALMLLGTAIMAFIILAIFVIPTARITAQRIGEHTEIIENPATRAEFTHVSSGLVQGNRGLREGLSCADISYDETVGLVPGRNCDMKISWFDFEVIKRNIPNSLDSSTDFKIEYEGKYYWITHLLA